MKNINLITQNSLSHQILYTNPIGEHSNYKKTLQNKLIFFSELIKEGYSSILDFIYNYLKSDRPNLTQYLDIFEEFIHQYNNFIKRGNPILDEISNELNHKIVSEDEFKLMMKIFEHQENITRDILDRNITIERLEVIINHLRDLPYYLRTDLEIETLPTINQSLINIYKSSNEIFTIIETEYNPFEQGIA